MYHYMILLCIYQFYNIFGVSNTVILNINTISKRLTVSEKSEIYCMGIDFIII